MLTKDLEYYKNIPYSIIIRRDTIDGENIFTAYTNELGRYSCYGSGATEQEAIQSFLVDKTDFITMLYAKGEFIPDLDEKAGELDNYSGIFNIRTSPVIHFQIAKQAKELGVSMNLYLNQILADAAGKGEMEREVMKRLNELCLKLDDHHRIVTNQLQYQNNPSNFNVPSYGEYNDGIYKLKAA